MSNSQKMKMLTLISWAIQATLILILCVIGCSLWIRETIEDPNNKVITILIRNAPQVVGYLLSLSHNNISTLWIIGCMSLNLLINFTGSMKFGPKPTSNESMIDHLLIAELVTIAVFLLLSLAPFSFTLRYCSSASAGTGYLLARYMRIQQQKYQT